MFRPTVRAQSLACALLLCLSTALSAQTIVGPNDRLYQERFRASSDDSPFRSDWQILSNNIFFGGAQGLFGLSPASLLPRPPSLIESSADGTAAAETSAPNETFLSLPNERFLSVISSDSPFVSLRSSVIPAAVTASGTWSLNGSGNWSTAANWQGSIVADGAGNTANFNAVNFTLDPTITLDSSRTIGNLYLGDPDGTNHIRIAGSGGETLTFDSGTPGVFSVLEQSAGSASNTIVGPIFFKNDLNINNLSANLLTIAINNVSPVSFSSIGSTGLQKLTFAGDIRVEGAIENGFATVDVYVKSGTVTFLGQNSVGGHNSNRGTFVEGGTLLFNGHQTFNSGSEVNVYNTGTLGGNGRIDNLVRVGGGGTITGGDTTTLGALTLVNLFLGQGSVGTYLANLEGAFSDVLNISGLLLLGGESALQIVGSADGMTSYTLATFGMRSGIFDPALVTGIPSGYDLVYHDTDIQLVPTPVPEPATWIGGALALSAVAFASRRRLRT